MINVPYLTDLQRDIELTVRQALAEDLGHLPLEQGDITASLIPVTQQAKATIISREDCVFCGKAWLTEVFHQLSGQVQIEWFVTDGDKIVSMVILKQLCWHPWYATAKYF